MFYIPSGTPSIGSSESGDGGPPCSSRNLPGLLDEQRRKGIAAAVLTITGIEVENNDRTIVFTKFQGVLSSGSCHACLGFLPLISEG